VGISHQRGTARSWALVYYGFGRVRERPKRKRLDLAGATGIKVGAMWRAPRLDAIHLGDNASRQDVRHFRDARL
jgi:hypothetical protein